MNDITAHRAISGDTLPMSVANMTFLVNRLSDDCSPLQYIRELTQNSIEAIQQLGNNACGDVIWDVDWNYFDLSEGVYKLCCIDTGAGMNGPEMVEYYQQTFILDPRTVRRRELRRGGKNSGGAT